jgi:F0F1-type ATP synthase membrane subunit c/vacuolar-type H+-ATPase subunit K
MPPVPAAPGPIDFEDAKAVRRLARIISFAIVGSAAAFAAVVHSLPPKEPRAGDPEEHALYTPFVIAAAALVLVATTIGTRMHGFRGAPSERHRKTFMAHVVSLALAEAATMLGLVLVFVTHSWKPILPAALGFAGLVTCAIRGEVRFSTLVDESNAAGRD